MRTLFPPAVRFPSERSNSNQLHPKTIANQKLPKIVEESPLVSERKTRNISKIFFSCFPYCKSQNEISS